LVRVPAADLVLNPVSDIRPSFGSIFTIQNQPNNSN
jgi:hypothetical protein